LATAAVVVDVVAIVVVRLTQQVYQRRWVSGRAPSRSAVDRDVRLRHGKALERTSACA